MPQIVREVDVAGEWVERAEHTLAVPGESAAAPGARCWSCSPGRSAR